MLRRFLRRHGLPLTVWTLFCLLFFAPFLLGQRHFSGGDLTGQFYAFARFQYTEMWNGQLPFWSPGSYAGFPFAADTQAAVFYLPRWITILLSRPWDFPYYALELEVVAHVWLTGLFTYAFVYTIARDMIGGSQRDHTANVPAHAAGLIAAVTFALSGYLASYPLSQLAILETVTWLPLVLLLLRQAAGTTAPLRRLLAAGGGLALSALAGHPQTFLHVSYLAAGYYLYQTIRARWQWRTILGYGALLASVVIGIYAVIWLPAIRYLGVTVRSDVSYQFVSTGMPLLDILQIIVPGSLGLASAQYTGAGALFLVLLAWLGRRQPAARMGEISFWAAAALLSFWLALGDAGILFALVHRIAPGFSLFRQQERLLGPFCFSMALLAGQGVVIWWQSEAAWRREQVQKTAVTLLIILLAAGGMLFAIGETAFPVWQQRWLQQLALLTLSALLLWRLPRRFWVILLFAGLLVIDLYRPSLTAIEQAAGGPARYWAEPAWLAAIPADPPLRIDSRSRVFANIGEAYGVEDIRGISPLKPQVTADLEKLPREKRWQLLNVQYVLNDEPLPGLEESAVGPPLYRYPAALPRAWMNYQPIAAPNAAAALELLQDDAFNPAAELILHPPLPPLETVAPPDTPPQVTVSRLAANRLQIEVNTAADGLLVLSEWAYPGWRAVVNGDGAPLYPANYALQTLFLPAGIHKVHLVFVPVDLLAGIGIALATLLVMAGLAWRRQPVVALRESGAEPFPLPRLPAPNLDAIWQQIRAHERWWLIGLILLAFGARIFLLGHQELRGDEAFSYLFAGQPAAEIIGDLLREGDPHSPFHYLLLHGWLALAGQSEFSMRFLSVVPGLLLVPILYRLGRILGGRGAGWLAALFAALSASLVWLAQDTRNQYTLVLLFTALATLLLHRAVTTRKRSWPLWTAYGVTAALAIYSHYYGAFALLAHGLYLLGSRPRRRNLLPWAGSGMLAAGLFAIWFVPMLPQLVAAGQVSEPSRPRLAPYLVATGIELLVGSTIDGSWLRWLFLVAAAIAIVGFTVLQRRRSGWAALLGGWLLGGTLAIYLVRFSRATFNEFYISVVAPAWWLLAAVGITALYRHGRGRRWLAICVAAALLSANIISLHNNYFAAEYSRTIGYREIAAYVAAEAEANELFMPHFPDPALDYYLQNVTLPRQMQPARPGLSISEVTTAVTQLSAEYDRIWLVPAHNSVWDREDIVPGWLDFHTIQERRLSPGRLNLYAYRPLHARTAIMPEMEQPLANEAVLRGVYIRQNGAPAPTSGALPLQPGDNIQINLLWAAAAAIPENYTVFVHLVDENGALIAQHDGVPAAGTRPLPTWTPGEPVLDWHPLIIPETAATNGRLLLGLYQTDTLVRVPFADGAETMLLREVRFE